MSETLISRTPNLIAAEIKNIKNQTRKTLIYNSIEIGRRLVEAKQMINHGEWGKWLKESVDYSQRTANNLVKIFEEYGADQISLLDDNTKSQAFANLGYSQAIALLEVPGEEREKFIEDNNLQEISTREMKQLIKEKKELQDKLKDTESKVKTEHTAWEIVSNSYSELEGVNKANNERTKKLKEEIKTIKDKNKEDLVNREVEIENLKLHIAEIKKQPLQDSLENNEETEKLEAELKIKENSLFEANKKIEELGNQLKEKAVDVTETIIEKIPEEVEKELQELREKVDQASKNSKPVVKFSIYFDDLVKNFKNLLESLAEIPDQETNDKYKNAVVKLINKMNENL